LPTLVKAFATRHENGIIVQAVWVAVNKTSPGVEQDEEEVVIWHQLLPGASQRASGKSKVYGALVTCILRKSFTINSLATWLKM
jgi:hypothetical protein